MKSADGQKPLLEQPRRTRITGTQIYQLLRCERSVYLDWFGNKEFAVEPDAAGRLLLDRGKQFEIDFVAHLGFVEPRYPEGHLEEGAAATAVLLRAGVAGVSQGVLIHQDLLGIPDLLRREEGASDLGAFHYVVGDVKSSRLPRGDQVMQVAFYSEILGRLQGRTPEYGYLVLRGGNEERFRIADVQHRLLEALDEVREHLRAGPPRLMLRDECSYCRWRALCHREADATDDLSRLPGFSVALRVELERIHVTTVHGLLALPRKAVESIPGLERLHAGARALCEGSPVLLKRPKLAREGAHVFLRIVRDPFLDRSLHFGLLRSDGRYSGFSSVDLGGDDAARRACLGELWRTEGPVYHLGGRGHLAGAPGLQLAAGTHGSSGAGSRLDRDAARAEPATEVGGPPAEHRLADLRPILWGSVVFPFRGQDLRSLARCFRGFEAIAEEPEGMPAVWFERWRETGDRAWLARITERNEAELRLLRAIHCWLMEALPGG